MRGVPGAEPAGRSCAELSFSYAILNRLFLVSLAYSCARVNDPNGLARMGDAGSQSQQAFPTLSLIRFRPSSLT